MDTGLLISQLPAADLRLGIDSSLVLVSQTDLSGMTYSKSISLKDIAMQIAEDLDDILSLSSAAYCESSDFAVAAHDHDIYTSAMFFPEENMHYNIGQFYDFKHDSTTAISISLSGDHSGVSDRLLSEIEHAVAAVQPHIGELNLVATSKIDAVDIETDIHSPGFEGWVPADGSSYSIDDFEPQDMLSTAFDYDGSSRTFTVPDLVHFFKIKSQLTSQYQLQRGHTAAVPHTHSIDASGSKLECHADQIQQSDCKFQTYDDDPKRNDTKYAKSIIHYGDATGGTHYEAELHRTAKITHADILSPKFTTSEAGDDDESWPQHNLMPAFVYVGRSKYSNPLVAIRQQQED